MTQTTAKDWKLDLPIDDKGGVTGGAISLTPPDFRPPFFAPDDDGFSFTTPVKGATTPNSSYPRTELREQVNGGKDGYWPIKDGVAVKATYAVNKVPLKASGAPGRVIILQIHAENNEPCRVYYDQGGLYCVDENNKKAPDSTYHLLDSKGQKTPIKYGEPFTLAMQLKDYILTVSATHFGVEYQASWSLEKYWKDAKAYVKTGLYLGVSTKGGTKPKDDKQYGEVWMAGYPWLTHDQAKIAAFNPSYLGNPAPVPASELPSPAPVPASEIPSPAPVPVENHIRDAVKGLRAVADGLAEIATALEKQFGE